MKQSAELAFLPAALEIANTPPSPTGRATLWVIILVFVTAIVWAAIGRVDIVAVAQGRVIPSGHSKVIQPAELGNVAVIHVANGDRVQAGEPLIELDLTAVQAEMTRWKKAVLSAKEDVRRYELLAHLSESVSSDVSSTTNHLDSLGRQMWSAQAAHHRVLEEERRRVNAEQRAAEEQLKKLEAVLPLVSQRARDQRALVVDQLLPKQQYLETEQQRLELLHDLRTQENRVDELMVREEELRARQESSRRTFVRDVVQGLEEASRRHDDAVQELIKAKARLSSLTLTAPVEGRVEALAVHHPGAVVTPAQRVMSIVPVDGELEVEAALENKDVGFVQTGQQVEVKIDAFPFTKYGTLSGEVIGLSSDSVADDTRGLVYTMRVRLEQAELMVNGQPVPLMPGMTATVESITGTRRVIEYLLSPLLRYREESARER